MKILLSLLLLNVTWGLNSFEFRSLSDVSSQKINLDPAKLNVFMVFQKDCHACRQQVNDLGCLEDQANVFLVGSFSTEDDLRSEYRTFNTKYPGVYGDTSFKKAFAVDQELTPQIIVNKGNQFQSILGMVACSKILDKIEQGFK